MALVSQLWNEAAQAELLGDLRIRWDLRRGGAVARLFREKPDLGRLVRTIAAVRPLGDWSERWAGRPGARSSSNVFWEWAETLPVSPAEKVGCTLTLYMQNVRSIELSNFTSREISSPEARAFLGRLWHVRLDGAVAASAARPLRGLTPYLSSLKTLVVCEIFPQDSSSFTHVSPVAFANGAWTQIGTHVFPTPVSVDILFHLPLPHEPPHLGNLTHLRISNNLALLAAILDDFPLSNLAALSVTTDSGHTIDLGSLTRTRPPFHNLTSVHLDSRSIELDGLPETAPALLHLRVAVLGSLPSTPFPALQSLYIDTPSLIRGSVTQSLTPPAELFPELIHLRLPLFPTRGILDALPTTLTSLDIPRGESLPLAWISSWKKVLHVLETARFRGVDQRVGWALADAVDNFRVEAGEGKWKDEGWWPPF